MRIRPQLIGLAALCAVASCGAPVAEPVVSAQRLNWSQIDPCSLVNPADLRQFGAVVPDGSGNFDDCALSVQAPDKKQIITISTGGRLDTPEEATHLGFELQRDGEMLLGRARTIADSCSSIIVFPDLRYVTVDVRGVEGENCLVADKVVKSSRVALSRGTVRSRDYPPNSLTTVDPCRLVSPELVNRVPGIEQDQPVKDGNGHVCQWGGRKSESPTLQVTFSVVDPAIAGAPVAVEVIAGRESLVRPQPSSGGYLASCRVDSRHIPFGLKFRENARVTVYSDRIAEQNCPLAKDIAAHVWAQLPKP